MQIGAVLSQSEIGADAAELRDYAQGVRDLILDRVKRLRSSGLGDEHASTGPAALGPLPDSLSPAHIEVLREIRDTARRLASADRIDPM